MQAGYSLVQSDLHTKEFDLSAVTALIRPAFDLQGEHGRSILSQSLINNTQVHHPHSTML